MADNLLESGLWLTLYGMGTVFVFLVILIGATKLMSGLVLTYDVPRPPAGPPVKGASKITTDTELVAVLSAAIRQHRKRSRR